MVNGPPSLRELGIACLRDAYNELLNSEQDLQE